MYTMKMHLELQLQFENTQGLFKYVLHIQGHTEETLRQSLTTGLKFWKHTHTHTHTHTGTESFLSMLVTHFIHIN